MPTYEKCPTEVRELANAVLCGFESHQPLLDARVTIDFVFARADLNEDNEPLNDAITKNGRRCLGITRKIPLKDRALGRADAEICLDGDWWKDAPEEQRRALLDHELHHVAVRTNKNGVVRDDLGRPELKMRKHDVEFGWFSIVAARHGEHSMERIQAKTLMDAGGQVYWPDIYNLTR